MFYKRLCGEPIGYSFGGIFIISRSTILKVGLLNYNKPAVSTYAYKLCNYRGDYVSKFDEWA